MSQAPILYITGTNTAVGKTTLAVELLKAARAQTIKVAALKPFSSGDRDDAQKLHSLQTAGQSLDEVNPFHFRDPITPLQAARNENRKITLQETLNAIRHARSLGFPLLIEGAGGLLSPLGEGFSLEELIQAIPGKVCIVGSNFLGTLNLILLTARQISAPRIIVLMAPEMPDASTSTNAALLKSLLHLEVIEVPRLSTAAPIAPNVFDPILQFWLK